MITDRQQIRSVLGMAHSLLREIDEDALGESTYEHLLFHTIRANLLSLQVQIDTVKKDRIITMSIADKEFDFKLDYDNGEIIIEPLDWHALGEHCPQGFSIEGTNERYWFEKC